MGIFITLIDQFKDAWRNARKYLLLTILIKVFSALVPFINIVGLGSVIDALVNGRKSLYVLMLIFV